jgi:glycosyltransferase involved in cell wall biosynthesis
VLVVGRGHPERGGIPTYIDGLCQSLAGSRYHVSLLNLARAQRRDGGKTSLANVLRTLSDSVRVFRHSRRRQIVHIHSAAAPTVTCLRVGMLVRSARARGARTIVHAHGGLVESWLTTSWRHLLARKSLGAADLVIAVSSGGKASLSRAGIGGIRLLPNGVDVDRFATVRGRREGTPKVLFVGGLTPRKGVIDLLHASGSLRAEGVEHELWLAGGVPDEGGAAYRAVEEEAGRSEVRLLGLVPPDAMPDLYAQADVFCLPSWWEAMPFTVLEAMASGLPVIATCVGDVERVVSDGVTGLVVPARDEHALTAALRRLVSEPETRRRMGLAGQERARRLFDRRTLHADLVDLYDQVNGAT